MLNIMYLMALMCVFPSLTSRTPTCALRFQCPPAGMPTLVSVSFILVTLFCCFSNSWTVFFDSPLQWTSYLMPTWKQSITWYCLAAGLLSPPAATGNTHYVHRAVYIENGPWIPPQLKIDFVFGLQVIDSFINRSRSIWQLMDKWLIVNITTLFTCIFYCLGYVSLSCSFPMWDQ